MKASVLALAGLCTGLAAATPLDKRAWATAYEFVTVTVTVTGFPPAQTPASSVQAAPSVEAAPTADATSWATDSSGYTPGGWWGAWRSWGSDSAAATAWASQSAVATWQSQSAVATTIETSAPISTYSPPSSVVVVESSTPASAVSTSVATSVSSDYQQGILDSHNIHRKNASVSDLVWSDDMASIAAQIAASCVYAHNTAAGGGGYGQNIGAGAPPSDIPAMITDEMYNGEINYYPAYGVEPDMSNFEKWGHYSQIVWKSTTAVGCATQYCPNGLANTGGGVSPYFTVCNYSPPGNFGGQYAANVLQPLGLPTVTL